MLAYSFPSTGIKQEPLLTPPPLSLPHSIHRTASTQYTQRLSLLVLENSGSTASAMEHGGYKPLVIPCDSNNIKITTPDDLEYAHWVLKRKESL